MLGDLLVERHEQDHAREELAEPKASATTIRGLGLLDAQDLLELGCPSLKVALQTTAAKGTGDPDERE